jgi:hypothetical protein
VLVFGSIIAPTEAVYELFQPERSTSSLRAGRHSRERCGHVVTRRRRLGVNEIPILIIINDTLMIVDLPVLDPLLSIAITTSILFNVVRHLKQALLIFLQAVPDNIDSAKLRVDVTQFCKEYRFAHKTIEVEWIDDTCRMELSSRERGR